MSSSNQKGFTLEITLGSAYLMCFSSFTAFSVKQACPLT
uniref:Uncharacterized protein n=1 Tax=Anguilla anguilla TaxID=7936 RepID=A0A0E9SSY4_ANGAN